MGAELARPLDRGSIVRIERCCYVSIQGNSTPIAVRRSPFLIPNFMAVCLLINRIHRHGYRGPSSPPGISTGTLFLRMELLSARGCPRKYARCYRRLIATAVHKCSLYRRPQTRINCFLKCSPRVTPLISTLVHPRGDPLLPSRTKRPNYECAGRPRGKIKNDSENKLTRVDDGPGC